MPTKRSNGIRNPSARAVTIAAGGEPPRKKARRVAVQTNPTNQDLSSVASTDQSATSSSTAAVGPQPISLSPGILDELVTQVADEVTRRLSPTNETSTTPINTSRPSDLSEMPLVSNPPPPDSGVAVPVTSAATTGMAGALVLGPLNNTQALLSGESQVPTELFSFPSLPIDAIVSEKLRAKIWHNEFFYFSSLLSNPVFEDRFHLTTSNSDKEKNSFIMFRTCFQC